MGEPSTTVESPFCDADKLIELMHAGDMQALERITRCYGDRLIAVGIRQCKDRELARDAVQDALVSVGEHMQEFRGDGSLEGWLARIVANACHRLRRGRKNDPGLHASIDDLGLAELRDSPEMETERGEMMATLGVALLSLSTVDRTILLLSDGEGWRGPEIAEAVGLTHNAVRSRLSRARRKLQNALMGYAEAITSTAADGRSR